MKSRFHGKGKRLSLWIVATVLLMTQGRNAASRPRRPAETTGRGKMRWPRVSTLAISIGYGRTPPHPRLARRRARRACSSCINYEEGGENSILHGDAGSEAFLSEIVGAQAWPGQRHMNMESIYEYGSRAGFWRLWRMFADRGLPVTVFGVATALQRNPEAVAAMKEAGWEIASHGLKWIDYQDFSRGRGARRISTRRSASIPR